MKRPLLKAITADKPPVLLIDEVDRADEEFEAFNQPITKEFFKERLPEEDNPLRLLIEHPGVIRAFF